MFCHWPPGFFKRCLSAKKNICTNTHTPWVPMFLSTWFKRDLSPLCLAQVSCFVLWYLEIHHEHSTLQYKDFNTYVEQSIHKIMQKVLWRMGNLIRNNPPKNRITRHHKQKNKSQGFDQETVSIDIGIWVLNLALLQEHFRNGLITWVLICWHQAKGQSQPGALLCTSTSHIILDASGGFIAGFDC